METYVVYLYTDPKTDVPRYVGKGLAHRPFDHLKWSHNIMLHNLIQSRLANGYDIRPQVWVVGNNLSAQAIERFWIAVYGREDLNTGTLFNHTDGGDGASNLSDVTIARMSDAQRKTWSDPDIRQRKSDDIRQAWTNPVVKAKMSETQRATCSKPEVKARKSQAVKDVWTDPAFRERMEKAHANPAERERKSAAAKAMWVKRKALKNANDKSL